MNDMKFEVKNEQHSKEIQECLFELGFAWNGCHSKEIRHTQSQYLFAYCETKTFTKYDDFNSKYFKEHSAVETTLEELKQMVSQTKKQPHVHADLIKAWADGAEIQCKRLDGTWLDVIRPAWDDANEYRIKPEVSDIQKYGIEVGDIWTDDVKLEVIKDVCNKETFTFRSIAGLLCQVEDKDKLIFRKGVIDRLNEL